MKESKKICRHLHLPLQSGSTRILQLMNRRYTKEQYLALAEKIRREIPDIAITTDIIVGFPGETMEDVEETIDVIRRVFPHALGDQLPYLPQYLLRFPAALPSPHIGNNAVAAEIVAAKHNVDTRLKGILPFHRKILHYLTFGCQMNARDSEKLVGILRRVGYQVTESEDADFVIFNTCTVRDNANQRVYGRLGELKSRKKRNPHMHFLKPFPFD